MYRKIIYTLFLMLTVLHLPAQKKKTIKKHEQKVLSAAEIEKYKDQCYNIISFLEGTLNFLGDPEQLISEKEIIINESYLKVFLDSKVQIEDDLDQNRQVPLRKDVQAYLKDIVFFYKHVKFNFEIKSIEVIPSKENEIVFKVTTNRNLKGVMIDNDTVDNNLTRYIEINLNPYEQDFKIASIYTTVPDQKEEMRYWWNTLSESWKMFFGSKVLVYDTLPMSRIAFFNDSSIVIKTGQDTLFIDSLRVTNNSWKINSNDTTSINIIDSSLANYTIKYKYDTIKVVSVASLDFYLKSIFRIKHLDISKNKTIKTLDPVARLTKLEYLNCSNTSITSLLPVRNLGNLKFLDFSNNTIKNLEPLKFCFAIEELNMAKTDVDTINVLANLTSLEKLILDSTKISNISPLSKLENLSFLSLANTYVTDLSPLSNLPELKRLLLNGSKVENLSPLSTLSSLEYINIDNTKISDLSPLANIPTLKTIQANNSAISDFDGLDINQNLHLIYCDNTSIDRDKAFAFMKKHPQVLVIYDSQRLKQWWKDLPPEWQKILTKQYETNNFDSISKEMLHKVVNTKKLSISGNIHVKNIDPVKMLFRLEKIDLSNTNISDISALSALNNLRYIDISNTPVSSLDALKDLTSIKLIRMDNTKVSDLLPLKENKSLNRIYCDNTEVKKQNVLEFKKYIPKCLVVYQSEILDFWWNNIDEEWRNEFKKIIDFDDPTREQLQEIVDLKKIKIVNNAKIYSLEPLAIFNFLKELTVNYTSVSDISPISLLNSLVIINLSNNPITDILPLANLSNIEELYLENTGVDDLSPIENFKKLKVLNIAGTKVRKLKPVSQLTNIEKLIVNNTGINKLKDIEKLPKLTLIKCYNTRLKAKKVDNFKKSHPHINVVYY